MRYGICAWEERIPPREAYVAASWSVLEPLQIVKTCKHGCCVIHPIFGRLTLPKYYRPATEVEIAEAVNRSATKQGLDDAISG